MIIAGGSLVGLIITLLGLGLVWWLVEALIPQPYPINVIVRIVFAIILIVILLGFLGIGTGVRVL